MGKTVAITGVNSYFAGVVLPLLAADPEVDKIVGIDVTPWRGGPDKVEFHKMDARSKDLEKILGGVDALYHLAFVVREIHDKKETRDVNVNGSKNAFESAARAGVKKVIYTSSITAYGVHEHNPLGLKEDRPLQGNKDSYYASSKVEVEGIISDFAKNHPEMTVTVIRAALLAGPNIDNLFSELWSRKYQIFPAGRSPHLQLIHEEDLARALYLAFKKDLPGVYNVGADDAISTKWAFSASGARLIPLPAGLLKAAANLLFALRLEKVSQGWVSLSEYTTFANCDKFKTAAGWVPRHGSEETYMDFVKSKQGQERRSGARRAIDAFLSWLYVRGPYMVPGLKYLEYNFMLAKVPVIRDLHPWMDPRKNSMTYLPINAELGQVENAVMPEEVVHEFIDKARHHVIMNTCGCRLAFKCEHHDHEIGCLFMGDTALQMPPGISRRVSVEEAHEHVKKAVANGLVPMTGKVRVDNFIFLTPDESRLLSVCFCCHCCCMMSYLKHVPEERLNEIMVPIEGISVEVTDACRGCGTCVEYCAFGAISIKDGKAVHSGQCRGCGRCERYCPNEAVTIRIDNPRFKEEVISRVSEYVDYAGGDDSRGGR